MIQTLFQNPLLFVTYMISLLVAIGIHEFSHAFVAERLGDPTPRLQGRVTLNPLAHIDMYGLLLLLLIGYGWGKPVEFDPYNLKNPRKDAALISVAGPISNFLLAIVAALILRLLLISHSSTTFVIANYFLFPMISLNVMLGIFNLLPIHPLDGFKIVGGLLPREKVHEWQSLARYGFVFLLLVIIPFNGTSILETIMRPILSIVLGILLPSSVGLL